MSHSCSRIRILLLITGSLISSLSMADWVSIRSNVPVRARIAYEGKLEGADRVSLSLDGFSLNPVITSKGKSFTVSVPGMTPFLEAGSPDVPKFAVPLIINDAGVSKVRVIAASFVDFPGLEIAPSKGNLYRTRDPDSAEWKYGDVYTHDTFWPGDITGFRDPYVFRDFRGQTLLLCPFSYNPINRTLRVYTDITVEVYQDTRLSGKNEMSRYGRPDMLNSNFAFIYGNHFINFPSVNYIPLTEGDKMLVICPTSWIPLMQPFVDWKMKKGMSVEVVDVMTAGGNGAAIQQFIAQRYSTQGISFVLLVGDVAQCPTLTAQGGASDPSYGYVLGADSYPEIMVGRFSAESDDDVTTQVQRVIDYELFADATDSVYQRAVVVASEQGPGDDNEMDWEHAANMRSDLLSFSYSHVSELYDGTHAGTSDASGDPSSADLFNLFQSGIGSICYTGHGSTTSFSTTGLSVSDVQNMTNTERLPFIWSVACVNGEFDAGGGPCFAESLLRARHNDQPAGAIAALMSSINQSWNPPMDAQDEMVDILVQSYPSNRKFTFGGLSVNGCMHMNDNYGTAGAEMTDTWHCFGDPSLNVRTSTPQPMIISHLSTLPVGSTSLLLNGSFDGALVALSMNGVLLGTASVINGQCLVSFQPLMMPDTLFVTVTGFNRITYTGMVMVVPVNGAYVIQQAVQVSDTAGNNNGVPDFGEVAGLDVELLNIGPDSAWNVSARLLTVDPHVTVLVDSAFFGNMGSGLATTVPDAFRVQFASDVPDQHLVLFDVLVKDTTGGVWQSSFSRRVNAPALEGGVLAVNDSAAGDGDGYLEAGESATLVIRCLNNGHSDALNAVATLGSNSAFLSIINPSVVAGTISSQGYVDVIFNAVMAPNIAAGQYYDLQFSLSAGSYTAQKIYMAPAGIILEDFESGGLNTYSWVVNGNQPWFTTGFQPFEGSTCAVSGNINDNQFSALQLAITAAADDSLAFWYKVSSELGWDFLSLYIDSVPVDSWSGNIPWSYASYPVTAGPHLIRFVYEKDGLVSSGSDCSWLDNIQLPIGAQGTTGNEDIFKDNRMSVWPNPSAEFIRVLPSDAAASGLVWQLRDLRGAGVMSGKIEPTRASVPFTIDVSAIPSGIYVLEVTGEKPVKVVITR